MARVFSKYSFDMRRIDLSNLYYGATDSVLYSNIYGEYRGRTYEDAFEVTWTSDGSYFASQFGGAALTVSGSVITGGTVTGYLEFYWNGTRYLPSWGVDDINIPAASLYDAATTLKTRDEIALIKSELRGGDDFDLSKYSDFAKGFSGSDRMLGNRGADKLFGNGGDDTLNGGGGNDVLKGGGGGDFLIGANGSDRLVGHKGADRFLGGKGPDTMLAGKDAQQDVFVFNSPAEARPGRTGRDIIRQFDRGEDVIDLSGIDADVDRAGNQVFSFEGAVSSHAVWVVDIGKHVLLRGDVDGDAKVDFEVKVTGLSDLSVADLIL